MTASPVMNVKRFDFEVTDIDLASTNIILGKIKSIFILHVTYNNLYF